MTKVLVVVITSFWAVAGSSCFEIKSWTVSLKFFLLQRSEVFFNFTVERIVGELPKTRSNVLNSTQRITRNYSLAN